MIYFIRHGQADYSEKDSKIYQGFGNHMAPLSPRGIQEIEETATDPRLQRAKLILSSPYGRALQSAAILSRRLRLPLQVETDLHEWLADKRYHYLSEEQAALHYNEFVTYNGIYPDDAEKNWESIPAMRQRVLHVLARYRSVSPIIVVCHGMLIQSLCGYHPQNGEIVEFSLSSDNVD
ncbi:histidine phosphatase family protein [Holdemania massiliensis]|uniref:histidine phosphatase family protein n=1 Tax=Holdemania massiliensis TaxID=1468449 RepID=UPI003521C8DC